MSKYACVTHWTLNCQRTKNINAFTFLYFIEMVGPGGLEPPTPALSTRCSNQLSYEPYYDVRRKMVEPIGIEPTTS